MKSKKEVETLMLSLKSNLATCLLTGLIKEGDDHEEYFYIQIGILAWILEDHEISTEFPDHYSQDGSHSTMSSNIQPIIKQIEGKMMLKKIKDGKMEDREEAVYRGTLEDLQEEEDWERMYSEGDS